MSGSATLKGIQTFGARYSCISCGRCCANGWEVYLDAEKVRRLERHDWASDGVNRPFLPVRGKPGMFRMRMHRKRCVMLDENNRCLIHARLRYEDKPETCKAFPLHLLRMQNTTYARLSHYCPAVRANSGTPLGRQAKWMTAVRRSGSEKTRSAPLTLTQNVSLSYGELCAIEKEVLRLLGEQSLALPDRLAAIGGMMRRLVAHFDEHDDTRVSVAVKRARETDMATLVELGRTEGSVFEAGPVFSLLLGQDTASPGSGVRLGQFVGVRLASVGVMPLFSGSMNAHATWRRLRKTAMRSDGYQLELLTRFLVSKVRTKRYVAACSSLPAGINLIVVGFAVTNALARLRAASCGRDVCDDSDVEQAVGAAELLVFEHSNLMQNKLYARFLETYFDSTSLSASLLRYLKT